MPETLIALTLETLADGAAVELFNRELEIVMGNINDWNTPAETHRTITLKVTVKPDETRTMARYDVSVSSKLAAVKAVAGAFVMAKRGGKLIPLTEDPRQIDLPLKPEMVQIVEGGKSDARGSD